MQLTGGPRTKNIAIYRKLALITLALVCKIVIIVQLRRYMQAGMPRVAVEPSPGSSVVWPVHPVPPVYMTFEESSVHYELDTPTGDLEWSSLAPDDGLIYLGDDHEAYSISMFHELRCLNIVRKGIVQVMKNETISTPLVQHCLNYLRQMVFCRSNTMLNGFIKSTERDEQQTILGTHQCNDWEEIYKQVEKNQDDHRRWVAERA